MKQCQKFHFLRCVIGLGRSYLHKNARRHIYVCIGERERDPYVHTWMISWLVVVVVEKQVSACWSDFCKLNFGKHYESQSMPALWRPIKSGGKIGINLWSVLLTHRGFSLFDRERGRRVKRRSGGKKVFA